jgi:hypothetical protein
MYSLKWLVLVCGFEQQGWAANIRDASEDQSGPARAGEMGWCRRGSGQWLQITAASIGGALEEEMRLHAEE